jgi:hypothetical protein
VLRLEFLFVKIEYEAALGGSLKPGGEKLMNLSQMDQPFPKHP